MKNRYTKCFSKPGTLQIRLSGSLGKELILYGTEQFLCFILLALIGKIRFFHGFIQPLYGTLALGDLGALTVIDFKIRDGLNGVLASHRGIRFLDIYF